MRRRATVLFLVSAAVLADEVLLVRAFSIGLWHHFAYMVISIALLGFGASGTLLAVLVRAEKPAESGGAGTGDSVWLAASASVFAVSLPLSFALIQKIPFEPYLIIWDHLQWFYLGCYYLVLFVPFFAAATVIGLLLISESENSPQLYSFNLIGSAAGAAMAVSLLQIAAAEQVVLAITGLAQIAALLAFLDVFSARKSRRIRTLAAAASVIVAILPLYYTVRPFSIRLSPYKGLSYALNLPDAKQVATRSSAIGRVDVVASPAIRHAPGLSLITPAEASIPPQLGIFVDGEAAGAITAFKGDIGDVAYLDWMSTAAHSVLGPTSPDVCVIGAGGGASVLLALRHGARRVDAVEMDANVVQLLRKTFRDFSGALYKRPEVRIHVADGRAFLEAAPMQWDVIDISLVDSFAAAAVGLGAINESYLYTREAFTTYLRHLRPGGILTVTRWIRTPPRDELKLFATAIAALEEMGLSPAPRLILVRSWATATLLVKREPFAPQELAAVRNWSEERLFDVAYFPAIIAGEGNRFNVLVRDWYGEGTSALLAGGAQRDRFFRQYPFFIKPATDDRPYFFHFFRWRSLPTLLGSGDMSWLPFVEWGYLILLATLTQAVLFGIVIIFMPLLFLRHHPLNGPPRVLRVRIGVLIYFLALGIGFMFVEMALIQRLVFFLANPIYAVAVVLAGLLLVSGIGSGWAGRMLRQRRSEKRLACSAALVVAATAVLYAFALRPLLMPLIGWPMAARIAVALGVMLPLVFMGMLFPLGLRHVGRCHEHLLPWGWAVNGCASVIATSLATLLAMGGGLTIVMLAAAACYLLAMLVANRWSPVAEA